MASIEADFPSERWFSELVARANADQAAMRRLGIAELRLGLEITDDAGGSLLFGIVLDGYDVDSLGRVDEMDFVPEVTISGPIDAWREMVASIEANGRADSAHTLNSLTIAEVPFRVRADDAMGNDKFFRFMGTLQAIFDAAGSPGVLSTVR
jgi:hypothetical protein